MKHKYNIPDLLLSVVGYKGLPYPGGFFPKRPGGEFIGDDFTSESPEMIRQEFVKGTRLYKQDVLGQWYFMPVFIKHPALPDDKIELPYAILNIRGNKNIVETPMVGRKGTVKELISINDYSISLAAFVCSTDGSYPADQITQIRELFEINESGELISVLTDLILDGRRQIVLSDIGYPHTPGVEDGQAVTFECVTDQDFELNIV